VDLLHSSPSKRRQGVAGEVSLLEIVLPSA
jgi:hypothetical protein